MDTDELLSQVQTQDLLKFGLIPEFVGRMPIVVALEKLDKRALISILTEPKNALIKQYKELFKMDNVELEIEKEALEVIAEKALEIKTGARGLRGILESTMTDVMFEIPSRDDIKKCVITKDTIINKSEPKLVLTKKTVSDKKENVS